MTKLISFGIHFHFATACHNATIMQKDYEGLDLRLVYLRTFAHVKVKPWRRIFFSISFQVVKFISNVLKNIC